MIVGYMILKCLSTWVPYCEENYEKPMETISIEPETRLSYFANIHENYQVGLKGALLVVMGMMKSSGDLEMTQFRLVTGMITYRQVLELIS